MSILSYSGTGSLLAPPLPVRSTKVKEPDPGTFPEFIGRVMPSYQWYEWNTIAAACLQQVADGKLHRLIITVPPQHGKTQLASRLFPAYFLRKFPRRYVGLTTYDGGISYGLSREARRFYRLDGGRLAPDSQNVGMWNTLANGGLWAAGVGGAVTSRPADLLVADDWIKGQREADSPKVRNDVKTFYSPTWRSRLQHGGAILGITTRWHHEDLVGYLMHLEEKSGRPEHWTILDMPAFCEPEHERPVYPDTCRVLVDYRKVGQVLCPERFTADDLLDLKATMQPRHWDSVYQCRPSSVAGTIFRREWLNWYDPAQPLPGFARTIVSVDAAFRDREDSDEVAFTVWGQLDAKAYLLDAISEQMDFIRTLQVLIHLVGQYKTSAVLVEAAANGEAILSILKKKVPGLVRITPDGGKEARAYMTQPFFLQGNVVLPLQAAWLPVYSGELLAFPGGKRNLVDSTTQALRWLYDVMQPQQTPVSWGRGDNRELVPSPSPNWGWADDVIDNPETYFPLP